MGIHNPTNLQQKKENMILSLNVVCINFNSGVPKTTVSYTVQVYVHLQAVQLLLNGKRFTASLDI